MPESPAEPVGEDVLVERARGGDQGAFAELVRRWHPRVYRWALVSLTDPDAADDVAQDVLVRLHRHLGGFRGRARFETWLYRVTRNVVATYRERERRRGRLRERLRDQSAHERFDPPWREEEAAATRIRAKRATELWRALLAELPPRQREVFDLADLQGWTPAEIATALGVRGVTVRTNLLKARRAIRERILRMAATSTEA